MQSIETEDCILLNQEYIDNLHKDITRNKDQPMTRESNC